MPLTNDHLAILAKGQNNTTKYDQPQPHQPQKIDEVGAKDNSVGWWFNAPETWIIDQVPGGLKPSPPSAEDLSTAKDTVQSWLMHWIAGKPNPFIHGHLYGRRLPSCLQDAYLCFTSYSQRNAANGDMLCDIVADKACQLVQHYGVASLGPLDALEHTARTQALFIYQFIGLFDGHIRLRHVAEGNIAVLTQWIHEAVDCARNHKSIDTAIGDLFWEKALWQSWILAESVRRTWLMVSMVQGMYMTSRDGINHCLGGMMFTSRKGFWDASTATTWSKHCTEVYGGLINLNQIDHLLASIELSEMDEFATLVLKLTFGSEQIERWEMQVA